MMLRALGINENNRGQVPVRQAKLVISCKVKVLVWISQRNGFVRFNPPPVSSVASPADLVSGHDCNKSEQRSDEAYTENCVGHRGYAHP